MQNFVSNNTQSPNGNEDFNRMVKGIRKIMPMLAAGLLIGVYAVSATASGLFLGMLLKGVWGSFGLGLCIAIAIQATRGILVFFSQLNPSRMNFSRTGELVAVAGGLFTVYEVISLVDGVGLSFAVAISLSLLMLAGIGAEIFLLKEIRYTTEMELHADGNYWARMMDFEVARRDFRDNLNRIKNGENPVLPGNPKSTPTPTLQIEPVLNAPAIDFKSSDTVTKNALQDAINEALNGSTANLNSPGSLVTA